MEQQEFQDVITQNRAAINAIRLNAHSLHESVNQTYDRIHPYGYHLDMVADGVIRYGHEVCAGAGDVLPMLFGAYFHDSIEDARVTYNDVIKVALNFMDPDQAYMAAELVFALTNDKGRTRAERAGENYYRGIRSTPYAPAVKLADRLANVTYSFTRVDKANSRMKDVYTREMPHFIEAITVPRPKDSRLQLPNAMLAALRQVMEENK